MFSTFNAVQSQVTWVDLRLGNLTNPILESINILCESWIRF